MFVIKTIYKEAGWWYWLATVPLLVLGVMGYVEAIYGAIALTAVQFVQYMLSTRDFMAFPVQVRTGYILLLLIGLLPYMSFIHWIQLFGTSAMVLFGYCPLARILSLMSWNRDYELSWRMLWVTFFSAPVDGCIKDSLPSHAQS